MVRTPRARLLRCAAGGLLLSVALAALSGCTNDVSEENPYDGEISRAFDNARSDYVREILSDGVITAAEVRDSQVHNVACFSEAGISRVLGPIGLVGTSGCTASVPDETPYAEEISRAFDNAESDYVREILRDGQITAAEVRDSQEHNIACLREAGISAEYVDYGEGYKSLVIFDARDDLRDAEYACEKNGLAKLAVFTSTR